MTSLAIGRVQLQAEYDVYEDGEPYMVEGHVRVAPVFYDLPASIWGAYLPRHNVILLHSVLRGAGKETLATLLAHEALHVADDQAGQLQSFNACVNSERAAAEKEADIWRQTWGSGGKPSVDNAYERQLNDLLEIYSGYREQFEDFLKQIYYPQCSRYS